MSEINFGSTFRIPITQQGINKTKKVQLKSLIGSYGGLIGNNTSGYARVSLSNNKDESFLRKLRKIGYKVFQEFEGENIPNKNLDEYIKNCLKNYEYRQHGRQKAPKPRNIKQKVEINNLKSNTAAEKEAETTVIETEDLENLIKPSAKQIEAEKNRIRQGKSYTDTVEKYGKEFAEALFFSTKK